MGERSQVWGNEGILENCPEPDAATGPNIGSRNATSIRLRSVGNQYISGKTLFRKWRLSAVHQLTLWLERLDGGQQYDEDHQNRRYLVDNTVVFLTVRVLVGGELLNDASKMAVHAGQYEHQCEFG